MKCPECQADNREGTTFCTECGSPLGVACATCGAESAPDNKFCGSCGKPLAGAGHPVRILESVSISPPQPLAEKVLGARSVLEGQRRQVTVLFTDIVGYTPLAESLGEEAVYQLMQRVFEQMIDPVHGHEGTVQDLTGDGIMALFGTLVALEDAPVRACRAALNIQQRMQQLEDELEAAHGVRPRLRIGIHTGSVVVGKIGSDLRMEFRALGDTVNLASRLQSLAEPGTVLMSEATYKLVEGYVEGSFVGDRAVKGKTKLQRVYQLHGIKSGITRFDVAVSRGLTRLVGRRPELESLDRCWQEAGEGHVHVADVTGDAGIGKSRLIYEFHKRLGDQNFFFLQGHCTADGRTTPFLPFIEVLRTVFRIGERESRQELERKLRRGLEILGLDPERVLSYLINLLGHEVDGRVFRKEDSEVVGIRTREALQGLLRERCQLSPVVLFIDDLHWIDSASEEILLWAAQSEAKLPLLIICAYRPHYQPPWAGRPNITEVCLEPLSRNSTYELLKERLNTQDLPGELTRLVAEKSEGNPLFAEEIANYLLGRGSLQKDEGVVSFQSVEQGAGLPVTLENLLLDRVDRLEEGPRTVLETASVIGRRFSLHLVQRVLGIDGAIVDYLRDLEREDLIFPDEADGGVKYHFKHVLVQDAVYNTLLKPRREELHEKVAQAIEQTQTDRLNEVADVLAHHFSQTPRAEKTVRYMALAGEKSLQVYSLEEAELHFRQVVELSEAVPGCADDAFLVDVLLNLARIYYFRTDLVGLIEMVERYLPVVEALGDKRRLSRFLFELGYAHVFSARQDVGKPLLERALALGEEIGDEESIGYALMGLMWHYIYWEPPSQDTRETVLRLSDQAVQIGKNLNDVWLASKALLGPAIDRNIYGRPHESRRFCLRLLEMSRETGDPRPRVMGLWSMGFLNAFSFNYEEAVENAEESLRISLSPLDRMCARIAKALALPMLGRVEEGLRMLRDVRSELMAGKFLPLILVFDLNYGAAMLMGGEMAKGVHWIEENMRRFSDWGYRMGRVYGHMILGEIYLQIALGKEKPPFSVILKNLGFIIRTAPVAKGKARFHLEEAVQAFREFDVPAGLAWSLFDLGLLHQSKKRPAEARACLEEAREIAEAVELFALGERIDTALRSLPS